MFISMLQSRRSYRKFTDQPVEADKIDSLIEAVLRAPSSRGVNPCEFVVVTDKEMLEKLSMSKAHGAAFLKNAPLGIVVCADAERQDVWIEDASIASITIHYAAASLGLSGCWIQIRERKHSDGRPGEDHIAELLNLPNRLKVLSMVAVGYPDEEKTPHAKEELLYDKVHREVYKDK